MVADAGRSTRLYDMFGKDRPDGATLTTRKKALLWAVPALVAVILVAVGAVIGAAIALRTIPVRAPEACSVQRTAAAVLPSVVTLSVQSGSGASNGSGQLIDAEGHVLTNDHVISPAGSSGTVEVVFGDGRTVPAEIVGRAPELDLAVVAVEPERSDPIIPIGRSDSLRVGQQVIAIGAPLGLSNTVTTGIVSAIGRDVPIPTDAGGQAVIAGAVQTDAAINPGNSGGALVDCAGRLVGVNTAIATVPNESGQAGGGNVGIGFAIPVDLAMQVAEQLVDTGSFTPAYFGAETTPLTPTAAEQLGVDGGLAVLTVTPDGPSAAAGLRPGDVITTVDGRRTTTADSLWLTTVGKAPGDAVEVEFIRSGQTQTATVELGS